MSRLEIAQAAFTALRMQVEPDPALGAPSRREIPIPTQLIQRESTGIPRSSL
jgi:hypothetical protein